MPKTFTLPTTPAPSEVDAIIAAIATTHGEANRAALRAAFEAGKQAARRRASSPPVAPPTVIDGDLVLTSPKPANGCGDWVQGRIGAFRFCAKVYPEHAEVTSYEIGRSRISKLELRRLDTNEVAYNWDRGLDRAATDAAAKTAVDRLAKHLANHLFGHLAE